MNVFQRRGAELLAPPGGKHISRKKSRNFLFCCRVSVGVGYVCALRGPGRWQLRASFLHSHFPNLFAVVTQDLEEPIQDLWQIIQQVNVWHGLQNQDLTQGKKQEGMLHQPKTIVSSSHTRWAWAVRRGPAEAAFPGRAGAPLHMWAEGVSSYGFG